MASPHSKRPADSTTEATSTKKPKKSAAADDSSANKPKPASQTELQKSLLESDAELRNVFLQCLREKPESIDRKQFVKDFWADRQHLLRAHAAERAQDRGRYNVLSEVKPTVREGSMKIDFGQDQIKEIFRMYPVVRQAHAELLMPNKPKEDRQHFGEEVEFWSEFFRSRLCKKLRGLRVTEEDARSPLLDRYLDMSEEEVRERLGRQVAESHVQRYIDVEGNEQNTKWKGNEPDQTMRPSSSNEIPIIGRLNATSERILSRTEPADSEAQPHAPIGMDEETWKEVRLRDLAGEAGEDMVRLNIKDQAAFGPQEDRKSKEAKKNPEGDSKQVVSSLRKSVQAMNNGVLDLSASVNLEDDSDSGSEDSDSDTNTTAPARSSQNKKSADRSLRLATSQVRDLIRDQHSSQSFTPITDRQAKNDTDNILRAFNWPPESRDFITEVILTHQTTNEFLHYFWTLLLSQSPSMSIEVPSLLGAMKKSLERLKSHAEAAEIVRKGRLTEMKKQAQQTARRTGKDPGVDVRKAGPSGKQVERLVSPLVSAIKSAITKGEEALRNLPAPA